MTNVPTDTPSPRTGGRLIVDQLRVQGVTDVFCVPGESYLPVLDALHDADIRVTVCRQEGGAAMMADAFGKLTGRPGVCMVTRGPGATNASAGLHVASQDSTPLILFVGQIETGMRGREAFQELDYRAVFGSMAKWVVEIDDPARVPELVTRAFAVAQSGRPGPVVVALPEDMLAGTATVADGPRVEPPETHPSLAQMAQLQKRLWAARAPMLLLGGSRWSEGALTRVRRFAERFELPVAVSFRRQMLFDHGHPNYAGDLGISPNPKLLARLKASDCLILAGGRLSEMPSQSYTLLTPGTRAEALVHVHADAGELGRVYHAGLPIHASPEGLAAALETVHPPNAIPWRGAAEAARAEYLSWSEPPPSRFPLDMGAVVAWLRERLPADAVITNGAGNYASWIHRFHRFRGFGTQAAPTSGSMGYGVPAAVAAKRIAPGRTVVAFAGDGCFLMTGQEFATAVQFELPFVTVVVDNGMYGTIRMHQEREFPGRVSATTLRNPDFAAYARAFGGHGETVRETAEFAPAFERALASGKPAILHCFLDPEAITPTRTLTEIRQAVMG